MNSPQPDPGATLNAADHEGWELQHVLFSLGYVDELLDEAELDAAIRVGHPDTTGEAA